jgi:hypothetical protein
MIAVIIFIAIPAPAVGPCFETNAAQMPLSFLTASALSFACRLGVRGFAETVPSPPMRRNRAFSASSAPQTAFPAPFWPRAAGPLRH